MTREGWEEISTLNQTRCLPFTMLNKYINMLVHSYKSVMSEQELLFSKMSTFWCALVEYLHEFHLYFFLKTLYSEFF
jgi:hypothetical protein